MKTFRASYINTQHPGCSGHQLQLTGTKAKHRTSSQHNMLYGKLWKPSTPFKDIYHNMLASVAYHFVSSRDGIIYINIEYIHNYVVLLAITARYTRNMKWESSITHYKCGIAIHALIHLEIQGLMCSHYHYLHAVNKSTPKWLDYQTAISYSCVMWNIQWTFWLWKGNIKDAMFDGA